MSFFELEKEAESGVAVLWLNRPRKRNFMNSDFWFGLPEICEQIEQDDEIRSVVIAGRGASFSMGLDVSAFLQEHPELADEASAEDRYKTYRLIRKMQHGMQCVAHLSKPTVAAVHRHCIGAGLDLISACDIRLASSDAIISLREVKVAIVADMGSLQRLPHLIGEAATRELALTGKDIDAEQAKEMGLVTHVYDDQESLLEGAKQMAREIAENSSFVLRGIKQTLERNRHRTVEEAFEDVALQNAAFLHAAEFKELVDKMQKRKEKKEQ